MAVALGIVVPHAMSLQLDALLVTPVLLAVLLDQAQFAVPLLEAPPTEMLSLEVWLICIL